MEIIFLVRNLKNKKNDFLKILITGAGSGLGKQAAIVLSSMGYEIFAGIKFEEEIEDFEKIIVSKKLKIHVFKMDILEKNDQNFISDFAIDILICNAAIGNSGSVAEFSVDSVRKVFDTNVFAHLECIQLAIKSMIERGGKGKIIILSSLFGRIPMPFLSPYCSSKFALDCFGTCLRQEMKILNRLKGTDIKVSLIEPGAYATRF